MLRRCYPASALVWPCPTPARTAVQTTTLERALHPTGSPPITRTTLPTCRVQYPGGSRGGLSIAPPLARPSPFSRRVGIHISPFEACSDFTHITAHRIAQPPKAAFVTRLQPRELPLQTARQLPELSTPLWVEPSSTGRTRLRGALEKLGIGTTLLWKSLEKAWSAARPRLVARRPAIVIAPPVSER